MRRQMVDPVLDVGMTSRHDEGQCIGVGNPMVATDHVPRPSGSAEM